MTAPPKPQIITLCGSSRFIEHFAVLSWILERDRGAIVLGLHYLPPSYAGEIDHQAEAEGVAAHFDTLHLRKIDLSDRVVVVKVGGYIGESTRREIAYARAKGIPIEWLEPEKEAQT